MHALKNIRLFILLLIGVAPLVSLSTRSFQIDELITYWITSSSYSDTIHRTLNYQGQSPLFFLLISTLHSLSFEKEWQLRLISILSIFSCSLYIYKIAIQFSHSKCAEFGACLFPLFWMYFYDDSPAVRPYELSTFFSILSVHYYIQFSRCAAKSDFYYSLISYVASVYINILTAPLILLLLLPLHSMKLKTWFLHSFKYCFFSLLLLAPNLIQLGMLWSRRTSLSITLDPTFYQVFFAIFPIQTFPAISIFAFLKFFRGGSLLSDRARGLSTFSQKTLLNYFFIWSAFPPLLFAIYSWLSSGSLFIPRYFCWSLPGITLLWISIIDRIQCVRTRSFVIFITLLIASHLSLSTRCNDDWRSAFSTINNQNNSKQIHLLLYAGEVEVHDKKWLQCHPDIDFRIAPALYYKTNAKVIPLNDWSPDQSLPDSERGSNLWVLLRNFPCISGGTTRGQILSWLATQGFKPLNEIAFNGRLVLIQLKPISHEQN